MREDFAARWWVALVNAKWKTEEQCELACAETHKTETISGPMCTHMPSGFRYVPVKSGKRWKIGETSC